MSLPAIVTFMLMAVASTTFIALPAELASLCSSDGLRKSDSQSQIAVRGMRIIIAAANGVLTARMLETT